MCTKLLPETTEESSGLKMSRISDGPGTTKQDWGSVVKSILLKTFLNISVKGVQIGDFWKSNSKSQDLSNV